MKKIIILSIFTIISFCIYSQKGQIDGFKNFKFNSMLSDYPNFNFKVHKELGYNQKYLTCHKVLNIPAIPLQGWGKYSNWNIFILLQQPNYTN